jgi:hypothetical protein
VVQSINNIKKLARRGKISGKWENMKRKKVLHINANILETITIIATSMTTLMKIFGNYIENLENYKIDRKKSNLLATYLSNHVESSSDVNENIF